MQSQRYFCIENPFYLIEKVFFNWNNFWIEATFLLQIKDTKSFAFIQMKGKLLNGPGDDTDCGFWRTDVHSENLDSQFEFGKLKKETRLH